MTRARNRVVVGVDGSAESRAALRWAIDEARLRGGEVVALYAWAYPAVAEAFAPGALVYDGDAVQAEAEEELEAAIVSTDGDQDVRIRRVVTEGDAADALIEASEGAQLLVVGPRSHGGLASVFLGSVSERCAHEARCPVVIVRGPGPERVGAARDLRDLSDVHRPAREARAGDRTEENDG